MNTLIKIYDVLKGFPWIIFIPFTLILMISTHLLGDIKNKHFKVWYIKVGIILQSGYNELLLFMTIIFMFANTIFFILWISKISMFSSLENYSIILYFIFGYSFIFGVNSFLIHITDEKAYIIQGLNKNDFTKIYTNSTKNSEELVILEKLLKLVKEGMNLSFIGYSQKVTEDYIRNLILEDVFDDSSSYTRIYKIDSTEIYYITTNTPGSPPGIPPSTSNKFIHKNCYFGLNDSSRQFSRHSWSFYDVVTSNKQKDLTKIINIISAQIKEQKTILNPILKSLEKREITKLSLFLYSCLLDFIGLNQNNFSPTSKLSRLNLLLFGLYRFLVTGTFISILIKGIIK